MTMPTIRTVDRQTLYQELWQTPGTQLARKYGVSDVALGKACRRHDIPRPPPGYWTLLKHGYEVTPTPLPPIENAALQTVTFHPPPAIPLMESGAAEPTRPPIVVQEELRSPHPLVEEARRQLRAGKPNDSRLHHTDSKTALNMVVGRNSISRALRIMDAMVKAWEANGGLVTAVEEYRDHHCTAFAIGEDRVFISLRERTEPDPDWKPPKESYWRRTPPRRPNGKLAFAVEYHGHDGLRSTWADGTQQRLEDMLNGIFDGLLAHIAARKSRRLDNECEGRQRAAVEKLSEIKANRVKREKEHHQILVKEIRRWRKAREIREYLGALRATIDAGKLRITNEAVFHEWTDWASWYADHIDPLVRAGPRPETVTQPVNKPLSEIELTTRTRPLLEALGISDTDQLHKVTEEQLAEAAGRHASWAWNEVCRVLESLNYSMAGREYWL